MLAICQTLTRDLKKLDPSRSFQQALRTKQDSLVAQIKNPPAVRQTWVLSLGYGDRLEEGMATHFNVLAWRISMDRGAWWAAVHGVTKSQSRLSD